MIFQCSTDTAHSLCSYRQKRPSVKMSSQCSSGKVTALYIKPGNNQSSVWFVSFLSAFETKNFKVACVPIETQLNGVGCNLFYHLSHPTTTTKKGNTERFELLGTVIVCWQGRHCPATVQAGSGTLNNGLIKFDHVNGCHGTNIGSDLNGKSD